jgi:serine/threonine-protein kinase
MGGSGGSVAVPDLSGASSIEEAKNAAGETFEVVEAERVGSEEPIGAVVSQNPASGEQADEGSTIFVETSGGVGVPDVEGEERGDAVRTLEDAGFEVEVEAEESSGEEEGSVIAQKPRAGENAEAGSSVEITVGDETGDDGSDTTASDVSDSGGGGGGGFAGGSGSENESPTEPPTDYRVPVPDVIGERVEDAEEIFEDAGFSTDVEDIESGKPKGTVVWTDPDPGVLLDPSSGEVVIGASSGPPGTSPETSPESPPDEQYTPPDEGS